MAERIYGYDYHTCNNKRDVISSIIESRLVPRDMTDISKLDYAKAVLNNSFIFVDNNGKSTKISLNDLSNNIFMIVDEVPTEANIGQIVLVQVGENQYELMKLDDSNEWQKLHLVSDASVINYIKDNAHLNADNLQDALDELDNHLEEDYWQKKHIKDIALTGEAVDVAIAPIEGLQESNNLQEALEEIFNKTTVGFNVKLNADKIQLYLDYGVNKKVLGARVVEGSLNQSDLDKPLNEKLDTIYPNQERIEALEERCTNIEEIKADKTDVEDKYTELKDRIANEETRSINYDNKLQSELDNEIERASKEESRIDQKLDDEIERATQADDKITENLNNEIETRTSEVARLDDRIDTEIDRATQAERILTDDLNSEILRAKEAESLEQEIRISEIWRVDTRIDNEINRATEAEHAITDKLDAEIDRSIKKDNDLQRQLVTINSASDVIDIVKTKQELLNYNQHITTNDIIKVMVDESFYGAITYYRYIQETTLNTLLAINHVNSLPFVFQGATYTWMRIASEGPYYTQEQINTLLKEERDARIDADTGLNNKINNEITRAKDAEKVLTDNLNSEIARATNAENILTTNLDSEIKRAKAAEQVLTTNLNSEITRAKDAEKVLTDNLDSEIKRARAAEKVLTDDLNSEITRAKDAESVLQTNIDIEEKARIDADTVLTNDLASEIHRANNAEETLDKKITTESERAVKAELKETEERTASDEYLQSQIDSITASSDVVDIVGTKQELINYDKPLNVSDIIKVLKDETLDNATTYYRYVEEATLARLVGNNFNSLPFALQGKSYTWVLIGSQGPYYTIAEIDALLDEIREAAKNESKRATDAEKVLTDSLNSEIERAKASEKTLTTDLSNEVTRATTKEDEIAKNLSEEVIRATAKEKTIEDNLNSEVTRAITSEDTLSTKIANEVERATNKETSLESTINKETTRAKSAEEKLASDLADEILRATTRENSLSSSIQDEINRAKDVEDRISNQVNILEGKDITVEEETVVVNW